jgi:hypothetical protein
VENVEKLAQHICVDCTIDKRCDVDVIDSELELVGQITTLAGKWMRSMQSGVPRENKSEIPYQSPFCDNTAG